MHRRLLVALAGLAGVPSVAGLAGCAPRNGGTGSRTTVDGGASPGTTPTGLATPSFAPSAGPVPTGLRVGGRDGGLDGPAGRDGRIVVYGALIGPVARVRLDRHGTHPTGTVLAWPANPALQAFWLRAGDWAPVAAAPSPSSTASPAPDDTTLVGADSGGKVLFTLPLHQ